MSLLLLAYPDMAREDMEKIQAYRRKYDLQYSFADPHFTIVFAIDDIPQDKFVSEVKKQSKGISPFAFTVNKASVNKNDFHMLYHSFLVPDEGAKNISLLHDKMYSKLFSQHLHPTIEYMPHITIGSAIDKALCEHIVAVWNETATQMRGEINAIDAVHYENGNLSTIEKIELH